MSNPQGLAFDACGNLYCANYTNGIGFISKITPNGTVSTFVSSGLNGSHGLAFDSLQNLYCANSNNNAISKITSGGTVSTFVSSGLSNPQGLAFDAIGNLYCSNQNSNSITKIINTITTVINVPINSYTVTNGIQPFNLDASSNSPALITYLSSDPSIANVNSDGLVTIYNSSASPITINISQLAITGYTAASTSVTIQVNASTINNPTDISSSSSLEYFLNNSSAQYGAIQTDIYGINNLTSNGTISKILVNGTPDIVHLFH